MVEIYTGQEGDCKVVLSRSLSSAPAPFHLVGRSVTGGFLDRDARSRAGARDGMARRLDIHTANCTRRYHVVKNAMVVNGLVRGLREAVKAPRQVGSAHLVHPGGQLRLRAQTTSSWSRPVCHTSTVEHNISDMFNIAWVL